MSEIILDAIRFSVALALVVIALAALRLAWRVAKATPSEVAGVRRWQVEQDQRRALSAALNTTPGAHDGR